MVIPTTVNDRDKRSDERAATELITESFFDLDVSKWLVPDPAARRGPLRALFELHVGNAKTWGRLDFTREREAVAVWFVGDRDVPPPPHYDERLQTATAEHYQRFRLLDEAFQDHEPTWTHHHLAFLAVSPSAQGRGLGAVALSALHTEADEAAAAVYADASSAAALRFYLRNGYQAAAEPYRLPGDGPTLWPVVRHPQLQ
ncbi:MAG: family acetyltransferase [Frankiales bacterium]|nr:family acetyltransferase [Frankiales bacterium]